MLARTVPIWFLCAQLRSSPRHFVVQGADAVSAIAAGGPRGRIGGPTRARGGRAACVAVGSGQPSGSRQDGAGAGARDGGGRARRAAGGARAAPAAAEGVAVLHEELVTNCDAVRCFLLFLRFF